jgi:hypothetical protein
VSLGWRWLIEHELKTYHREWRHSDLSPLYLSYLYCLYGFTNPEAGDWANEGCGKWPQEWPNGSCPGVYLMFDQTTRVLVYIGSAYRLTTRLNWYFPNTGFRNITAGWPVRPAYIATVRTEAHHQAVGLETYLIDTFGSLRNKRGVKDLWNGSGYRHPSTNEVLLFRDGKIYSYSPSTDSADDTRS